MHRLDKPLRGLSAYAFAFAITLIMAGLRGSLTPTLGLELPFITLFPALFIAAWAGGLGPALLATATGVVLALYFFFPITHTISLADPVANLGAGLFVLTGIAAGILGESRLQAQTGAELTANQARKSEERYRTLIEQTSEGIWRLELEQPVSVDLPPDEQIERFYTLSRLVECNDTMANMYGFGTAAELVGASLPQLLPRSDPGNLEFLRDFIRTGYRLSGAESHELDRSGQPRYFLNNLIGIVANGHLVRAWGSQRDITEMKRAEVAVQASEARFRSVFESGMIGIGFWNREVVTGANDALLGILGYDRADLDRGLLQRDRLWSRGGEEVDRRAAEELRRTGSCTPYEKELWRKDGSKVPVLMGAARLGRDDKDLVFFLLDLTERHRAEERLRQAERIEVVGQLAGGMAHEANNQMSVVLGATEFILRRSDVPAEVRQDAEYIRAAAERTASITRQLLAFSRRQILQPESVDLNDVVKKLEPILRRTLTEQQNLFLRLAPDLAAVRADPVQLDQVLLNLAINARDAMPQGGVLTIETRNVEFTSEDQLARPDITIHPGPFSALIVSDTGHGIDKETMKHVFEPFFTTKGVGRGSGLGLAMVYGIVKQSGGYVWPYSEPGLGTTFKIYLPSIAAAPRPAAAPVAERPAAPSGATVLVVEDDPLVRTITRRALAEAGFAVLVAGSGQEALDLAAREQIDLVLTDLAMPGLNGLQLAERLPEVRSGVPVVFMSGYTDNDLARRGLLDPAIPYLEKPFTPQTLVHTLRDVLSRGTSSGPA